MTEFVLQRHEDPSGVSGTGEVAWGCEWPDGAVAVRWPGEHPSTAAWEDIRDVEAIHGHKGKTLVTYTDESRLLDWYDRLFRYLCSEHRQPTTCGRHPDMPGRIRLTFDDLAVWRFWIGLLDGSSDAAIQEEVDGLLQHRWATPDGLVWLVCYQPLGHHLIASEAFVVPEEDPLETYDREDR